MFSGIFGGKNWYDSLTAWGVILIGGGQAAETVGIVPPGATEGVVSALTGLAETIGGLLVVLGIRRAASAPNTTGG